jgi:hypothetical protein
VEENYGGGGVARSQAKVCTHRFFIPDDEMLYCSYHFKTPVNRYECQGKLDKKCATL